MEFDGGMVVAVVEAHKLVGRMHGLALKYRCESLLGFLFPSPISSFGALADAFGHLTSFLDKEVLVGQMDHPPWMGFPLMSPGHGWTLYYQQGDGIQAEVEQQV